LVWTFTSAIESIAGLTPTEPMMRFVVVRAVDHLVVQNVVLRVDDEQAGHAPVVGALAA
jgi:hypothetical protein